MELIEDPGCQSEQLHASIGEFQNHSLLVAYHVKGILNGELMVCALKYHFLGLVEKTYKAVAKALVVHELREHLIWMHVSLAVLAIEEANLVEDLRLPY